MRAPKVSVVITCYNYAQYLPFALRSALSQSYSNVEVIVINDGSPDNTDEVVKPFLSDTRLIYIKQANGGQAVAKNAGIKAATGEFVAFLDADDIWEIEKLSRQMPLFSDPEVGVVYSLVKYMDADGTSLVQEVRTLLAPRDGWVARDLFLDNFVPFCAAVVRRSCFDEVGMMDETFRMGIDWDLWLRMSVKYKFAYVDALLSYRVGHAGQMSKNFAVREKDTMRIMEKFLSDNPGLIPRSLIKWAYAYSYCNRGYYFRKDAVWKSLAFYLKAIRVRVIHKDAYIGILKLIAYRALISTGLIQRT